MVDNAIPAPAATPAPSAPTGTTPAAPVSSAAPATPAPAAPAAAPDAPAGNAAATPSLASGTPTAPVATPTTPADWPSDWREKLAGEDKAFLNQLKRYASPNDVGKWLRTTQLKISAGELKEIKEAPKDATPEQLAAWRKEQGLPEQSTGYVKDLKLPDGMVLGEADKPLIESFAARALDKGVPQETFNALVGWWYETQDQLMAQRQEAEQDHRISAEQSLIQKWGADFKPNMQALKVFWTDQPSEVQATILGARTADGRVIGDIPEVTEFFANLSRELNPAATLLPVGITDAPKAISARKAEIEDMMYVDGKPNPGYFGNEQVQKEYRDLIDAEQRFQSRAA